jgi:hydrogenase large subunit
MESQLVANWNLEFFDRLIDNIKGGDERMANVEKWDEFFLASRSKRCR